MAKAGSKSKQAKNAGAGAGDGVHGGDPARR